jgi:hypothetical protein
MEPHIDGKRESELFGGAGRASPPKLGARSIRAVSKREDIRNDIHAFLTSRRAGITPERARPPVYVGNRGVSGLGAKRSP